MNYIYSKINSKNFKFNLISFLIISLVAVFYSRELIIFKNLAPGDTPGFHFPLIHYYYKFLKDGIFPLWDTINYSGMPFFVNAQAALYYPFHIIFFIFLKIFRIELTTYSLNYLILLHQIIFGLGVYVLTSIFNIDKKIRLSGSLIAMGCGQYLINISHLGLFEMISLTPYAFYFCLKGLMTYRSKYSILLAITLATIFMAGFVPYNIPLLVILYSIFIYKLFVCNDWNERNKIIRMVFESLIIYLGLISIYLIPMYSYLKYSADYMYQGGISFFPEFINALFPTALDVQIINKSKIVSVAWSYMYMGLFPLILLICCLFYKKRDKNIILLLTLLAFIIALSFNETGLIFFLQSKSFLKFFFSRGTLYLIFTGLIVTILVPLILNNISKTEFRIGIFVLTLFATLFAIYTNTNSSYVLTRNDFIIFSSVMGSLFLVSFSKYWKYLAILVSVLELGFIQSGNNYIYNPTNTDRFPLENALPEDPELYKAVQILKSDKDTFRIAANQNVTKNFAFHHPGWGIWGLEPTGGNEGIISTKYQKFIEDNKAFIDNCCRNRWFGINPESTKVYDFLNIKYYFTEKNVKTPNGFKRIFSDRAHSIFEYENFKPRFLPVSNSSLINLDKKNIVIEKLKSNTDVKVLNYSCNVNACEIFTQGKDPAFLHISLHYFDYWKAKLNDNPILINKVNDLTMGISLPAGKNKINLLLRPKVLFWGKIISLFTLVIVILNSIKRKILLLPQILKNSELSKKFFNK